MQQVNLNSMNQTEKKTVAKMIQIYCTAKHNTKNSLCLDCSVLNDYAQKRLDRCHFGENKPNCQSCPIHCYNPEMRIKIQKIMKFSGPRMILKSPLLTLRHLAKGLKHK